MSRSLLLALVVSAVAALPLLLTIPHDVICHNALASLAPDLAPFPASALPTSSGYLTADPSTKARLFYTFYEASSPPGPLSETPLILWLQGGPGCSSEIGNFYELGPWRISESLALEHNPGAWNEQYGVLFIDNPVGTGFSIADRDEDIPTDQAGVAAHLYQGLLKFFAMSPEHGNRPFFLAGESYAGKYVPALGHFLVEKLDAALQPLMSPLVLQGQSSFRHPFRLDGLIIGNALVHPRTQVQTHADTFYWVGLIDQAQREEAKIWAQKVVGHVDRAEWADAYRQRTDYVHWLQNISGIATPLDVRRQRAYHVNRNRTEWLALVLNRPQVKAALKADPDKTWISCCPRVRRMMANDTMKSTKAQVEYLLTRLPILMYQGMFDLKDGAACSEEWMREMHWTHTNNFFLQERELWTVKGETAGYWRSLGSLTHVVLLGAGHEVPADQTLHSQAMVKRWIEAHLNASGGIFHVEIDAGKEHSESTVAKPAEAGPAATVETANTGSVGDASSSQDFSESLGDTQQDEVPNARPERTRAQEPEAVPEPSQESANEDAGSEQKDGLSSEADEAT